MTYGIFAIEDYVAHKFIHLFTEDNSATALRSFRQWCQKIGDCKDFRLWYCGTWDIYTGDVQGFAENELVIEGTAI